MGNRSFSRMIIMLLLFCILLGFTGCSKKDPAKKPKGENKQTESQEPETFTSMVEETETLIMDIGGTVNFIEIPVSAQRQGQQGGQEQKQGEQKQPSEEKPQDGQEQGGEKQQDKQGQGGQEQQTEHEEQPSQPQDVWTKAESSIRKIHQEWNNLEPEAVKAGLTPETRDSLERIMEELTRNVGSQKAPDSLISAIEMYGFYADIADVFKSKLPAPLYKLKYEIMIMAAYANMQNWAATGDHQISLTQQWEMLKMKDEGDNSEDFTQTEYALNDFERAIETQQKQLALIKAEIALKNLDELGKKLLQAAALQKKDDKQGSGSEQETE